MQVSIPSCSSSNVNLPVIVYGNSWLSQTAAIGSSTIYTLTADGLYRLSFSIKVTGASSDVTVHISWTGQDGMGVDVPAAGDGTGYQLNTYAAKSGDVVAFYTSIGGSPTYNVYVCIEQLL